MDGEQRRHQRTRPEVTRHVRQDAEQKDRRSGVQQNIGQMASPGAGAVDLAVQHEGEPRQGMPVRAMAMGEGPGDCLGPQTVGNQRIFADVLVVIKVDEPEMHRLAKHQHDRQQKKTADHQCLAVVPRSATRTAKRLAARGRRRATDRWSTAGGSA